MQPLGGLSVLENCTVGACFGRENLPLAPAREVAREVASWSGSATALDMLAGSLTTAGKKRLELGARSAARPRLLLLDEVLAGLNPTETERMIETVRKIRDSGVAILMIEHIMRAVMSLSDRIVVLNLGSKLAEGSPRQVADNPERHRRLSRRFQAARAQRRDRRERHAAAGRRRSRPATATCRCSGASRSRSSAAA